MERELNTLNWVLPNYYFLLAQISQISQGRLITTIYLTAVIIIQYNPQPHGLLKLHAVILQQISKLTKGK